MDPEPLYRMDDKVFEELLEQVQKPARYLGNEWNAVKKDLSGVDVKFALCFPDLYEIGMSHLGFKLIYHLLNEREDIACERVFAPGLDLEDLLRRKGFGLFSLESKLPVRNFDIVGISLTYEMTFTNALNILDLSGIPLLSSERRSSDPLVIAGGVASFNPEPMSDFIDLFVIGEAEEALLELVQKFKMFRKKLDRTALIKALSEIKGVYAPSLYKVGYNPDGTIKYFQPIDKYNPRVIEKRLIKDLDESFYPVRQLVPFMKVIHDRVSLEIMRGCPNKCRFCQAWVVYHHKRERSVSKMLEIALESKRLTGYDEISLLSLSSGDYSHIEELISGLVDIVKPQGISVSLPSLRIDKGLKEFPSVLNKVGIRNFTFAPEAGSERLRAVIGKDINMDYLEETAAELTRSGWKRFKLYFMIGLPGEKDEDLDAILNLIHRLKGEVSISVSSFIPKPHTPFQWHKMQPIEELRRRAFFLKDNIRSGRIKLDFHDPDLSFLEGVLSRGDRKIGRVIYSAFKKGARFDSWSEHFNFNSWLGAFEESGVDPHFYVYRRRTADELLPWDHIGTGISKEYLIKESEEADRAR